jgi:hypothetical protein
MIFAEKSKLSPKKEVAHWANATFGKFYRSKDQNWWYYESKKLVKFLIPPTAVAKMSNLLGSRNLFVADVYWNTENLKYPNINRGWSGYGTSDVLKKNVNRNFTILSGNAVAKRPLGVGYKDIKPILYNLELMQGWDSSIVHRRERRLVSKYPMVGREARLSRAITTKLNTPKEGYITNRDLNYDGPGHLVHTRYRSKHYTQKIYQVVAKYNKRGRWTILKRW